MRNCNTEVNRLREFLHAFEVSKEGILIAALGVILALILPLVIDKILSRTGRLEPNFRGDEIPTSFGALIAIWAIPMLLTDRWLFPDRREERLLWIVCVTGFCLLGWIDDVWGDKKVKGLRGHFRYLIRDRRITTGLVKAVGGLLLAFWLARSLAPENMIRIGLMILVIALSSNAMNLLDLRPGRAGGAFLCVAIIILVTLFRQAGTLFVPGLLYVILPALLVWERDSRASAMMGDTGSAILGGTLGLSICLYAVLPIQIIVCMLLIAFHVLTERRSLTQLIEKVPLLKWLDELTGVR